MSGDPLAEFRTAVRDCRFCPKMCRFACPVAEAEASEAATPTWKGTLVDMYLRGEAPLAGAVAEAAYKCTDCRLAHEHCLHGHEPSRAYAAVRAAAFAAGVAPEAARTFAERVRRLGNPFAADLRERLAALVPAGERLEDGGPADVALFPGCTAVHHAPDLVRDARAVVATVERAAIPCAVSGAGCCGYPLHAAGDLDGFRALAERTARAIAGVREIVVLDPGCAHTINVLWPSVGVRFAGRARHIVERLHERIDAVRAAIRAPIGEAIAYHDPCYLGRHMGVYDAPRALLREACGGRAPNELSWSRERAWCSGAGAIYAHVAPEAAGRIRDRRLDEAKETGADRLATACPSSLRMFEKGAAARGEAQPLDVVSILATAMGLRDNDF